MPKAESTKDREDEVSVQPAKKDGPAVVPDEVLFHPSRRMFTASSGYKAVYDDEISLRKGSLSISNAVR